jgi:hypothetical protein
MDYPILIVLYTTFSLEIATLRPDIGYFLLSFYAVSLIELAIFSLVIQIDWVKEGMLKKYGNNIYKISGVNHPLKSTLRLIGFGSAGLGVYYIDKIVQPYVNQHTIKELLRSSYELNTPITQKTVTDMLQTKGIFNRIAEISLSSINVTITPQPNVFNIIEPSYFSGYSASGQPIWLSIYKEGLSASNDLSYGLGPKDPLMVLHKINYDLVMDQLLENKEN